MSVKKQQQTCAICLDEIAIEKEVRLDCCEHKYCDQCITTWVETQSSSCPQCKEKVHKLISKDVLGRDVETNVDDKSLGLGLEAPFTCTTCHQAISEDDFMNDRAEICDCCLECAIHLECMSTEARGTLERDGDDWLCAPCIELVDGVPCICPECAQEQNEARIADLEAENESLRTRARQGNNSAANGVN